MNTPNQITASRILALPFIIFFLTYDKPWADFVAGAFIAWSLISDIVDGAVARRNKIVTKLGANLDPIADALTFLTIFFMLHDRKFLPLWLPMIFLYREIGMLGLRRFASLYGITVSASRWGKIKTFCQSMAVSFGMLALLFHHAGLLPSIHGPIFFWGTMIAAVVSVFSFANYCHAVFSSHSFTEDQKSS